LKLCQPETGVVAGQPEQLLLAINYSRFGFPRVFFTDAFFFFVSTRRALAALLGRVLILRASRC